MSIKEILIEIALLPFIAAAVFIEVAAFAPGPAEKFIGWVLAFFQ